MEPGESSVLSFFYISENGELRVRDRISDLRNQIYFLSPAAYFDGDKVIEISLTLPWNAVLGSNLSFEKEEKNRYSWSGIIDEETDLYLTFGNRILFMFSEKTLKVVFWIILFMLIAIKQIFKKRYWIGSLALIGIAVMILLLGYTEPYLFGFVFYFAWPIVLVILLLLFKKTQYKEYKIAYGIWMLLISIYAIKMFF
jgi:hypothetical protein